MRSAVLCFATVLALTHSLEGGNSEIRTSQETERLLQMMQQKVTWDFRNQPLRTVICEVARSTHINFHLASKVDLKARTTHHARNLPLHAALAQLLNPLLLEYEIQDEVVKIRPKRFLVLNTARLPVIENDGAFAAHIQ
jgi:type II secretory pathway component GspD/PulD (secretin)